MPQRTHRSRKTPSDLQDLGAALDAMNADELRSFVRGMVDTMDGGCEHTSRLDLGFDDIGAPVTPRPALPTPSVIHVLQRSHAAERLMARDRSTMLEALRSAASARTDAVISHKRRRTYVHAAMLTACCVELEALAGHTETGARWVAELRERTRRFPAFQEALRKALGHVGSTPHHP